MKKNSARGERPPGREGIDRAASTSLEQGENDIDDVHQSSGGVRGHRTSGIEVTEHDSGIHGVSFDSDEVGLTTTITTAETGACP
jgi:hypothetical protein